MIVYMLVNSVNSKAYIGQSRGSDLAKRWTERLNRGSNLHLTAAIKKYGPEAFTRQILAHCSRQQQADNLERLWIAILQTHDPRYGYNKQFGGLGGTGRHTPESRRRISEGLRRMWSRLSPKERWEFELAAKLRWLSLTEDERQAIGSNIAKAMRGKPQTLDHRQRMSKALKRYWAKGRKSQPKTPEHRRHIGEALRRYWSFKGGRNACGI